MTTATADAFLDSLAQRGYARPTRDAYGSDLAQFERFLGRQFVKCGWAGVTAGDAAAWADHLAEVCLPATRQRKLAALRSFARWADLPLNVPLERLEPRPPRVLTDAECSRLLALPASARDRAMLLLLLDCGLRVSELVGLDGWSRAHGWLRVAAREVPLTQRAEAALTPFRLRAPTDPLFVNHRGERLSRQGVFLVLGSLGRRAGVDRLSPGVLRATCAATLLRSGADRHSVARVLGVHVSRVDRLAPAVKARAAA